MTLRGTAKYLGGVLLAVGLLWWVLHGTEQRSVWEGLKRASLPGLALAGVLSLGHNVFRAWRWRALLEPVRPGVPFRPMFDAIILGYLITWTVPGRLGELVRPALLSGRQGVPIGPCLGSVVADRVLDGIAVLALFGAGAALTPLEQGAVRHVEVIRAGAFALVGLIGVPLVLLILVSRSRSRLARLVEQRAGLRGRLGRALLALSQGVDALKEPALLARVVLFTLLAWLTIAASTWAGLRASGVEISFAASLLLQPLLALGIALPTPGGAGGYHAMMRIGLIQLFAVAQPLAVSAGLLTHAASILPIVLAGCVLLVVDRIPFQDLLRAARQLRDLGARPAGSAPRAGGLS
jgi:uncharacterized protein (TIRG00374 family)